MVSGSISSASRAWRAGRADWKLHVLSSISLAVAFVCLGAALLVVFNLDSVRERWSHTGRASIFLRDGISDGAVSELRSALERTPGVVSVRYVSSNDARRELLGDSPDDAVAGLPSAAFPSSVEVNVGATISDTDLTAILAKVQKLPSVESVETYQRYTDKLRALLHAGVAASSILALIVLSAVASVIASTARLTLQRRRIEIDVLRLVGASEQYVRRPFVLEGSAQGAAGAAIAVILLGLLYVAVRDQLSGVLHLLLGISPSFIPWPAAVGLVVVGALLGAISSHVSLKRLMTV